MRLIESREEGVTAMERKHEDLVDLGDAIELGAASAETKGGGDLILDSVATEQNFAGLSDD